MTTLLQTWKPSVLNLYVVRLLISPPFHYVTYFSQILRKVSVWPRHL